jgi:predicted secreted hydrolase
MSSSPGQVAWDWLSLQLDDKTEFMLHRILRRDAVGMLPSNEIRGGE